jgi:hypothetical protein
MGALPQPEPRDEADDGSVLRCACAVGSVVPDKAAAGASAGAREASPSTAAILSFPALPAAAACRSVQAC